MVGGEESAVGLVDGTDVRARRLTMEVPVLANDKQHRHAILGRAAVAHSHIQPFSHAAIQYALEGRHARHCLAQLLHQLRHLLAAQLPARTWQARCTEAEGMRIRTRLICGVDWKQLSIPVRTGTLLYKQWNGPQHALGLACLLLLLALAAAAAPHALALAAARVAPLAPSPRPLVVIVVVIVRVITVRLRLIVLRGAVVAIAAAVAGAAGVVAVRQLLLLACDPTGGVRASLGGPPYKPTLLIW